MDSIRDHLILYISDLKYSKKMYEALTRFYTIKNFSKAISLRNKIRDVKMIKNDTMESYFLVISQIRDQIKAIEEEVPNKESIAVALNGLPESWDSFASSISGRETAPPFDKLWATCNQEESRLMSKGNIPNPSEDS